MKKISVWSWVFLITSFLSATKLACMEIVEPASYEKAAEIAAKIKKQKAINEDFYHFLETMYIIDINNDGKNEYVFCSTDGTMHCLVINVFTEDKKRIRGIEMPWGSEMGCFEYYRSPFVKAGGKIFICTTNDSAQRTRIVHVWENGNLSLAADKFWIGQQRKVFNNLYQEGLYSDAYVFLESFEANCRELIDPQVDLWLRNDLALAALKDKCPNTSLKILKELMSDKAYKQAPDKLKKAVECNNNLCKKALANDCTKGKYDYSWVLADAENSPETTGCGDGVQFNSLLNALVPDVKPDYMKDSNELWKNVIRAHFGGPVGHKEVINNRYFIATGCVDHCCCSRAFLWCDTKEKISAIATLGNYQEDNVIITSRSLELKEIPKEFYKELKKWVLASRAEDEMYNSENSAAKPVKPLSLKALFYDRFGKETATVI